MVHYTYYKTILIFLVLTARAKQQHAYGLLKPPCTKSVSNLIIVSIVMSSFTKFIKS